MRILKSLVYFEDAEREPMPQMMVPVFWTKVKKFFEEDVKKLSRS